MLIIEAYTLDNNALELIKARIKSKIKSSSGIIEDLIKAVSKLWSFDTVVKNYTTHRLDHNLRVLYYALLLIDKLRLKVDEAGYFLLASSCLLHDIGLQCQNEKILSIYGVHLPIDSETKWSVIRKNHAVLSVEWIKHLHDNNEIESLSNPIRRINAEHLDAICKIILYHSGPELFDINQGLTYRNGNEEKDLMLLVLLMRLADELDIGRERGDLENPIANKLPLVNASFFWMHYFTLITVNQSGSITLCIELNPKDVDKEEVLKENIYWQFISKNNVIAERLKKTYSCPINFEYEFKTNSFIKEIPFIVFDHLASKSLERINVEPTTEYTYKVPDIVKVFNMDVYLMPLLYRENWHHAFSKEQAMQLFKSNPYMTIGAYKNNRLIGYLTLLPVRDEILDEILNFKIMEDEIALNEFLNYDNRGATVSWYIGGLGVINEERGSNNYPSVLAGLINEAGQLINNVIKPSRIRINRIGTVAYTLTGLELCTSKFKMSFVKQADFDMDGFYPQSFVCSVSNSNSRYLESLKY